MQATWRLGSLHDTALATLLGMRGPIPWRPATAEAHGPAVTATAYRIRTLRFPLPDLPAQHWIVPSYSCPGRDGGVRAALSAMRADGSRTTARLASVGPGMVPGAAEPGPGIDAPIDAFVTTEALRSPVLTLDCAVSDDVADAHAAGTGLPARAQGTPHAVEWFSCSVRPAVLDVPTLERARGRLVGQSAAPAPAFSQLLLPDTVRHRTCSPVSVAMACNALGIPLPRDALVAPTLHSGMYGVWPANIAAASALGIPAACELFSRIDDVVPLLLAGVQVVVSTRWAKGSLEGAPLPESGGHLMLLRGLDAERAWVHDPAAASDAEVARGYRRDEFCRIWLGERGATYLLLPPTLPQPALDRDPA